MTPYEYLSVGLWSTLLQAPVLLGVALFLFSLPIKRPIAARAPDPRLVIVQRGLGTLAPLTIALVWAAHTLASIWVFPYITFQMTADPWRVWWIRPLATLLGAAALLCAWIALRRVGANSSGSFAPAAARRWSDTLPSPLVWIGGVALALIVVSTIWLGLIPTEYVPLRDPVSQEIVSRNSGSAPLNSIGWAIHAPVLLAAVGLTVIALMILVTEARAIARRSHPLRTTRVSKLAIAHLVAWISVACLVLTLGVLWTELWASATSAVRVDHPESGRGTLLLSEFQGLVGILNTCGRVLQAIGFALLLRILRDTRKVTTAHSTVNTKNAAPEGQEVHGAAI